MSRPTKVSLPGACFPCPRIDPSCATLSLGSTVPVRPTSTRQPPTWSRQDQLVLTYSVSNAHFWYAVVRLNKGVQIVKHSPLWGTASQSQPRDLHIPPPCPSDWYRTQFILKHTQCSFEQLNTTNARHISEMMGGDTHNRASGTIVTHSSTK